VPGSIDRRSISRGDRKTGQVQYLQKKQSGQVHIQLGEFIDSLAFIILPRAWLPAPAAFASREIT